MATLIAVNTMLTRAEIFVPTASSVISTTTSSSAPQSNSMPPPPPTAVLTSRPTRASTFCRYCDQPLATTAAPTANSSTRSQPMIQAMNSPKVAYENVYALPATGTVDANSA